MPLVSQYLLKISNIFWISDVFRGYRKANGMKWVMKLSYMTATGLDPTTI